MSNPHWLDLSEYLAIALAVVGSIAAATSAKWGYAVVPILISLILSAVNRWRFNQNLRILDRALERKLDAELQQQGEVLQQEIAQARSFATALVKQTIAAKKSEFGVTAGERQEVTALEQKFDLHQQLMQSMQAHVTGVEGSLKEAIELLEGTAIAERVEYLERHLTQVSQQLGIDSTELEQATASRVNSFGDESEVDITPLLDMISEDLMSGEFMSESMTDGDLSDDLW